LTNGNRDVYLTPFVPLPDGQLVTVTIAGVTDPSGNQAVATATQFTVGASPDVSGPAAIATNPVNGLVNVPTNVVIALRLSEAIDPSSVTPGTFQIYDNALGQLVPGAYTVSGDSRTISFVPSAPLAVNRSHSVYFAWYGITDLAGNALGSNGGLWNFSFTTGATADVTGPQVVALSPGDQFTAVPRNVQVMIDFDRTIDVLSADQITLSGGSQPVAQSMSLANGDARVILTPLVPLQPSTVYTATIGTVTDLSGLPLATPVTSQFTTGPSVDLIAPFVTAVTPANGAQNVALNATVQIAFNERVNRLSINPTTLWLLDATTGQRVAGDVVISLDGLNAAFIPSALLTPSRTYYVQMSGFVDLTGQQGSMFTSFRTTP